MAYETILYRTEGAIATITLNRPEALNTIVPPMPDEVEAAVHAAVRDPGVKVIVVRGAGRAFCAGYDFGGGFHHWDELLTTDGRWDPGKDMIGATAPALAPTQKFMSVWRSPKPVIAQVHGWCVGGGSDFALCADLVIASEDARIGTPYSRIWGAYLSGMWIYRLGLAKAKEYALTGRSLSGVEAADVELINEATKNIPPDQLRMHICWGNYEGPHHLDIPLKEIVDIVLGARPATISVEAANPRHEHEWALWEEMKWPEDKVIVPGVIDSTSNFIEHPELIAQRIVRFGNVCGRENVIAGSDCGFGTFAALSLVYPSIAWAKLKVLAEGAAIASQKLWR